SLKLGFFPYIRIPTRYIFAPTQTTARMDSTKMRMEMVTSHQGTPKGIRINMTMGEVRGIWEKTTATVPCGSFITEKKPTYMASINGTMMGSINCWVSVSLSTAAPMA